MPELLEPPDVDEAEALAEAEPLAEAEEYAEAWVVKRGRLSLLLSQPQG